MPLVFVGYEALENIRHSKRRPWLAQYKWVVYFFVAVAFWKRLEPRLRGFEGCRLHRVRVYESRNNFVDFLGPSPQAIA